MTDEDDVPVAIDEVNCLVQELWLESPGVGIALLHQRVQERLSKSIPRPRIKTAKALLPYRFCGNEKHDRHEFIVRTIQERQSLRARRRFQEADRLHRGLQAMGVEIDDVHKSWTAGEPKVLIAAENQFVVSPSTGVKCESCGLYFASRNLVFKHLRDPASGCGTSIFASGESLSDAPSAQNKKTSAIRALPSAPGRAAQHAPASHSVWIGDLPLAWSRPTGQYKRLRALLFAHLPNTVPEPWIRKVTRKAYRSHETGDYLGYAITVFRDEQEATTAHTVLDGKAITSENTLPHTEPLPHFTLRVRPAENGQSTLASIAWRSSEQKGNRDPPLEEQLRPLHLAELRRRIRHIHDGAENGLKEPADKVSYFLNHQAALEKLVSLMKQHPRRQIHSQGRLVPDTLVQPLLGILRTLRWPAKNARPRLTSERYFVLPTNVTNDRFYGGLRHACRSLMDWTDPDYYYSGIAVTRNFVASPHIDEKDQNYQYAVSLGDFTGGGQLCVESQDGDSVDVVNTVNRIARVDGRRIHWVQTWEEGDRYSLIFYDTRDRNAGKTDWYEEIYDYLP